MKCLWHDDVIHWTKRQHNIGGADFIFCFCAADKRTGTELLLMVSFTSAYFWYIRKSTGGQSALHSWHGLSFFSRTTGPSVFPTQILWHDPGQKGREERNSTLTLRAIWQRPLMPANCNLSHTPQSAASSSPSSVSCSTLRYFSCIVSFTPRRWICIYIISFNLVTQMYIIFYTFKTFESFIFLLKFVL